jgi:hypothetical protein
MSTPWGKFWEGHLQVRHSDVTEKVKIMHRVKNLNPYILIKFKTYTSTSIRVTDVASSIALTGSWRGAPHVQKTKHERNSKILFGYKESHSMRLNVASSSTFSGHGASQLQQFDRH